jgi:hypothetical protein
LVASLPLLEAAFAEKKVQPTRPEYDAEPSAAKSGEDEDAEDGDVAKVDDDEDEE